MKEICIQGRRLVLREIRVEDLPLLLKWRNSETYQKHCLSIKTTVTIEELDKELVKAYASDRKVQFVAWNKNQEPVGTCWVYRYNDVNKVGYVTTFVSENHRQVNFYGVEMFLLICQYMYFELNCRKIYCEVHADNQNSLTIFSKINAHLEGVFRNHVKRAENIFTDLLIFAIYKEEYEKSEFSKRFLNNKKTR